MAGRTWKWDTYDLRKFKSWSIGQVLDIGANRGTVSLMCRILFPIARIIAIEPCKETYDYLTNHVSIWGNINCQNIALGNGNDLFFKKGSNSGWNRFFTKEEKNIKDSYSVKSYYLNSICKMFDIGKYPYIIKIDCEGGERFILNDLDSIKYISNSIAILMELHLGLGGTKEQWDNFFLNFKDTHDLLLCSWHRDSTRRYYIYNKINMLPDFKRIQIQLLRKDWKEKQDNVWWLN